MFSFCWYILLNKLPTPTSLWFTLTIALRRLVTFQINSGGRLASYAAPHAWNKLPVSLKTVIFLILSKNNLNLYCLKNIIVTSPTIAGLRGVTRKQSSELFWIQDYKQPIIIIIISG